MFSQMDRNDCPHARKVTEVAEECLQKSPYRTVRSVSCQYEGGALVLRGRLPSFYHKQLAQEAVLDVQGVTRVVNETEVTPAPA
jgi:osmotically-inducible protein OsmY